MLKLDRLTLWGASAWILSFAGFYAITYPIVSSLLEDTGIASLLAFAIAFIMATKVQKEYISVRRNTPERTGFVDSILFAFAEFLYLVGGYYTPIIIAFAYTRGWLEGIGATVGIIAWMIVVAVNMKKEKED